MGFWWTRALRSVGEDYVRREKKEKRGNERIRKSSCLCWQREPSTFTRVLLLLVVSAFHRTLHPFPFLSFPSFNFNHLTCNTRATVAIATLLENSTGDSICMWLVYVAGSVWRSRPTYDLPKGTRPVFVVTEVVGYL